MTKSQKIEHVTTCVGETLCPSHLTYSLVSTLLSLVASCKQRDGLVVFSFVPKYQQTTAFQSLKAHKASARANGRLSESLIAMRSYRRTFTPSVVLPVFSMILLLSEGTGCHRGLWGGASFPKTPIRSADGHGISSLYSLNNNTRPAFQTVRLGGMGRLKKRPTTQKQGCPGFSVDDLSKSLA